MTYVLENEAPIFNLLVWGLREAGQEAISAPLPEETERFALGQPAAVIVNCELDGARLAGLIKTIRATVPAAAILDLNAHAASDPPCDADFHLAAPYSVPAVIDCLKSAERKIG